MDRSAWETFLRQWSKDLLATELAEYLPPEVVASGWLGFPGATEKEIQAAEARLGTRLPPSYREFLKVTNGWHRTTHFIDRMWSTSEVAWLRERNQDLIDAWRGTREFPAIPIPDAEYFVYGPDQSVLTVRHEYIATALEISDWGDSALYMLNPKLVTPDGEWEAWFFANWLPGANRYRSFQELMLNEYKRFKELEDRNRGRRPTSR